MKINFSELTRVPKAIATKPYIDQKNKLTSESDEQVLVVTLSSLEALALPTA